MLRFLRDDGFALVFDMHGVMLRIGKTNGFTPATNTVLGWEARDIGAAMREAGAAGRDLRALPQHGAGRAGRLHLPDWRQSRVVQRS